MNGEMRDGGVEEEGGGRIGGTGDMRMGVRGENVSDELCEKRRAAETEVQREEILQLL